MTDNLPITDAEREVMDALWERSPLTSGDIVQAIQGHTDWQAKTIRTLISRLTAKGMVQYRKQGRRYYYAPAIAREEFLQRKSHKFVQTFFKGKVAPLVAAFAEQESLSREDVEQLRKLIDSLDASGDKS
ncbi:MAG TPA: BlaI/MecI/CopY family transcriptional regulator [Gammaproteobacteria bacterium]|nr:BlaI/MecI/CopY family transcriptional regulator [Gammaproteobacteria bacterium]